MPHLIDFLDDLVRVLYKKEYFGFIETAEEYVSKIYDVVPDNIKLSTHKLSLCLVLAISFIESNPTFLTFAATQVNSGNLTRKEFAEVSDLFYKLEAIARKAKS